MFKQALLINTGLMNLYEFNQSNMINGKNEEAGNVNEEEGIVNEEEWESEIRISEI